MSAPISRDQCHPLVAHVEAEIERDLIVARASRVQACSEGSDSLAELRLDGHVDVFFVLWKREGPGAGLIVEYPERVP